VPPDLEVRTIMSVETATTNDTAESDAHSVASATAGRGGVAPTESARPENPQPDDPAAESPETGGAKTDTALDTGTDVTFASLELPAPLLNVLAEAGVVTAFPIQAATIPDALIGRDVLGRGRTGSGKTLAFGLPTLVRLEGLRAKPRRPLALVLVPTRELAMQVEDALRPYARALRLRIRSVYGGAPMRKQIDGLRYGTEVLVATPGRLSDLIERGECELDEVDVAILDEADQMCDMGFLPHVCELMDQVAEGGQRLLFSATLDGAVDEIVKKYMNDPALHEVDPQAGVVSTMSHRLLLVAPQHKAKVAAQIAARHGSQADRGDGRSIFFVRTQMAVDRVVEQLRERGLPVAGLHGGMNQVVRTKTLEDFKEGRTPVLIATDVAARGIHVDGIDLVVHLDPPRDAKDYLHRAGRTARAGKAGVVASLILPKQRKQAQRMLDAAGVTAEVLDAAPVGAGPRWEAAGAALAQLTGAREVPEPGDVAPFSLPVRERERVPRPGGRWDERHQDGDRYGRDDRRGGSFERRVDRGDGYRGRGFEERSGSGRGPEGRRDEYQNRDLDRGRHGDRYDRHSGSFERRNDDGRRDAGRDGRRDSVPVRAPERRTGEGDGDGPGAERADGRGLEFRRFEPKPDGHGSDTRGSGNRGFNERGHKDRGAEARSGFNRDRGTERAGYADRYGRDDRRGAGQRPDRDRAARRPSS
jgi:superfamily II DNA/RNA helicase